MRERFFQKKNSGFTLVETLAAVAILVVLLGISAVAVLRLQKYLEITRLDNAARGIYMAAQNRAVLLSGGKQLKALVQGEDNDLYLHHSYDKAYSVSGSIFVDSGNRKGFVDSNTIIYGHHMKNGSMFASLSKWSDQQYYEEHPVMWLLTPERDYKVELFSGYTTSAYAETYTMFPEPGAEVDAYLERAAGQSDFQPAEGTGLDGEAHYVLLSTCAYVFDNARSVLHGKLVPVDSAGGVPLSAEGSAGEKNNP